MKEYSCSNCQKLFHRYESTVSNPNRVYCCRACRYQHQSLTLTGEHNPNFRHGNHTEKHRCKCGNRLDYRAKKCIECIKFDLTKDELGILVKENKSYLEVAAKTKYGRNTIRNKIKLWKLDISHFQACKHRNMSLETILVKHSPISRYHIRSRILKANLLEYKCKICEQDPTWNNLALTLELDHINGDPRDNRIENLRFLCPNCHSQQPTTKGKKRKEVKDVIQ